MKTLSTSNFLLAIIIFLAYHTINYPIQNENLFEAKLSAVYVGNELVPESNWDGLKIQNGLPIKFIFSTDNALQTYYRIFLDGNILETKLQDKEYVINDLNLGVHILRVLPLTAEGNVGKSFVFTFTVVAKSKTNAADQSNGQSDGLIINPFILYILIAAVVIQLALIIILILKRKGNKIETQEKNNALQELTDIRLSHKRIIEDLKNQKEENDYLRKKIKELDQNIELLEQANLNLLKQKEKLTESKRKLEMLHNQKEELFAIAIHDIKNPAAAIQGYIQLLNSYELNATEQHEIMQSLASSSENIVKLSQNMCEIIAQTMPEPKLGLAPASMQKIVSDVCNQNIAYAKTKKVKLLNKSSRDIPELSIDSDKILEALDNYVNNAIKYAPPDTIVEVKSYLKQTDKKVVIVEVSDNGVGLSEDDVQKCFQKGVILSSTPTGLEQSSGLGLWIVKKIIEEHNGTVWVNSKLGAGSTFGFELPLN